MVNAVTQPSDRAVALIQRLGVTGPTYTEDEIRHHAQLLEHQWSKDTIDAAARGEPAGLMLLCYEHDPWWEHHLDALRAQRDAAEQAGDHTRADRVDHQISIVIAERLQARRLPLTAQEKQQLDGDERRRMLDGPEHDSRLDY